MERLEKEREEEKLFQERLSQRVDKGELETERLCAQIRPLGLGVRQVAPDGHCMFSAVSLALAGAEDRNSLRTKVADCLRSHAERFRPFMLSEEGDVLDEGDWHGSPPPPLFFLLFGGGSTCAQQTRHAHPQSVSWSTARKSRRRQSGVALRSSRRARRC